MSKNGTAPRKWSGGSLRIWISAEFTLLVTHDFRLVTYILHCPEQVGGHPETLSKYERQLGLNSTCFCEGKNPFTGVSETVSYFDNRSLLRSEISRWLLLLRSVSLGGIVHLNNGRFITPFFGEGTHPKESLFPKPLRKMIRLYALGLLQSEIALHRLGAKKKAFFFYLSRIRRSRDPMLCWKTPAKRSCRRSNWQVGENQ